MISKIDKAFSRPVTGIPLVLALFSAIFFFIGKFVAGTVVNFTQETLFGIWYYNLIINYMSPFLDPDSLAGCILIGEYGILTMVPTYLLGLLLPIVASFYFVMILLEDSCIFYRIAATGEAGLRNLGLSGASSISLLLGFGCVTAALISAQTLKNRREKLILSILLSITVPCSAQLTMLMIAAFTMGIKYLLFYLAVTGGIFAVTGLLLNLMLPGKSSCRKKFLPPLKIPSLKKTLQKTFDISRDFIKEAAPTFALGGAIMAVLNYTNGFVHIYRIFSPITCTLLNLPKEATDLFVLSIIKKDLGAAGLYSILSRDIMSEAQLTLTLIVMTLFVPCFASLMILLKEWGPLLTSAIFIGSFVLAFLVGGLVSSFLT